MEKFIKNQIIKQGKISQELGIAKYEAYFVNTKIYENYRLEVEEMLIEEGYGFCIPKVEETNGETE